jgi:aspartate racemase
MAAAARSVHAGGADFMVLCTNTMHKVAEAMERDVPIPLLHIADPTAQAARARGIRRVGLLGTRFTMEDDFYRGRLRDRHGLEVLVPEPSDQAIVHRVIYDELCLGQVLDASREQFLRIIQGLAQAGAEGVILGCTEISLLVERADLPLFDTALLHARAAAEQAMGWAGPSNQREGSALQD